MASELLVLLPAVAVLAPVRNNRREALPLSSAMQCRRVRQCGVLLPHASVITATQARPTLHLPALSKPEGKVTSWAGTGT